MRCAILAALFLSTAILTARAEDDAQAQTLFNKLLAAQTARDYNAFVQDADDGVKAALTATQFNASCDILNARTKGGYDVAFLGELNKNGIEIYLYRLRFKDGGNDLLATLSLRNGKVAGILFH